MGTFRIIEGEAIEEMARLIARGVTVDACITDTPYGTTACAWDAVIPFAPMWASLKRVVKRDGAIVLFGAQPFTSALVMSNPKMFRYSWTWDKVNRITGFLDSKRRPLRVSEDLCVFYGAQPTYNPQMVEGEPYDSSSGFSTTQNYGTFERVRTVCDGLRYPQDILRIEADNRGAEGRVHPTQKPVELLRYLVRTYTNPGDTVLDFTAGSFSTGVACVIEGRNFIGIEQSADYCRIGEARMKRASGEWAEIPRLNRKPIDMPLFGTA